MLSSSCMSFFTTKLRDGLRGLIFRRTKSVNPGKRIGIYYVKPQASPPWESCQLISEEKFHGLTPEEKERQTRQEYETYSGYTSSQALRSNDPYGGMDIEFTFETNAQFNLEKLSFDTDSASKVPPQAPILVDGKISTVGDLICGWVDPGKNGKDPEYVNWFVCSEQFFRAWTLIMYDNHEVFPKIYGRADQMRKRMLSGNRLNTNSYLKWLLGCIHSGVQVTEQEMIQHFYSQRTEYISKFTVHTYTSLALLVRYGELPRENNIPNNADNSYKMKEWSLFPGLLEKLIFNLAHTQVELTTTIPDPFEPPLIQEPVSQSSESPLIQRLQSLEETLKRQLYLQQLQQHIWQQEWQLQQQQWRVQQSQWLWAEREKYLQWEIQCREQMRREWEIQQKEQRQNLENQQDEEAIHQLDEILQEGKGKGKGKEEEETPQKQMKRIQLKQKEPEDDLPVPVPEEKEAEPVPKEKKPEPQRWKKPETQRWKKKNKSQKQRQNARKEKERIEKEKEIQNMWKKCPQAFSWADACLNQDPMDYDTLCVF